MLAIRTFASSSFHPEAGRTFAQINRQHKQRLSHRGKALEALVEAIRSGSVEL